jgi:hypothetical protein
MEEIVGAERESDEQTECARGNHEPSSRGLGLGRRLPGDCADGLRGEGERDDRPGDVLDLMRADVREVRFDFAADLFVGGAGKANSARVGEGLQPRRDIDAVAEKASILNDDIADIHPHAKSDALGFRQGSVAVADRLLQGDGASRRIDDAAEFQQQTVADRVDYSAPVVGDRRIDELAAILRQSLQRSGFILSHHSTVADNVGHHDRGQRSLDGKIVHSRHNPPQRFRPHGPIPREY